ncbi:MAG: D-TA family PLP-dependent enzyme [Chloroflexi bacterium]|nr:D-TA family PLP-dependent enzyme [Chloroflexota bacterium]
MKNLLETPVAILELDQFERNLVKLQRYLDAHGIANRPHIKTHKIPEIARMQIEHGAVGITCQKLGEAEVMADAGITDIFLPYNILGEQKLARLVALAKRVKMSVTADSAVTVHGLSAAMQHAGLELETLVEFDTGAQRCGVQTPAAAAELARLIAHSPGLYFGGLMTFPCNANTDPFVLAVRELLHPDGIAVQRISGGGTARMWHAHEHKTITEYRSGMYIYGDRNTLINNAMSLDEIAFKVICTVVSRPTADRGILDGGSKTFSSDASLKDGHGLILEYPEARFYGMSEEHGHVDFSACPARPQIGERVTVIPNHCCPVSNLFNEIIGVRSEQVEQVWRVAARGLLT